MLGKKTGGRKKGTPNKATAEVMQVAQQYTEDAIRTLADIMKNEESPTQARVSAANALLDRAHGKPSQHLTTDTRQQGPIEQIDFDALTDDDLRTIAALPTKRGTDPESQTDFSTAAPG